MTPLSGTFQPCGGLVVAVVVGSVAEKQDHGDVHQKRETWEKLRMNKSEI